MNKLVCIKIFNDILDEFLIFLNKNFKSLDSDIILMKNYLAIIRNGNPRITVEKYMDIISNHKKKIFDCDDMFFLEMLNDTDDLIINKIKNIWISGNISKLQKAYVWMYFQKLINAGEKVTR